MTDEKGKFLISDLDSILHALQARFTLNISPISQTLAFMDWWLNLLHSPSKQLELGGSFFRELMRLWDEWLQLMAGRLKEGEDSGGSRRGGKDKRFADERWENFPFNMFYRAFLSAERWWQEATTSVPGVAKHHEEVVSFMTRQFLDIFSPYLYTNPEIIEVTRKQWGANLFRGWMNFLEDVKRALRREKPVGTERFAVGKDLAATRGKVVYRNRLIELIQYAPTTDKVWAEPIVIIPAWIMKYYILDLSPHNSLVKFLVDKGHSVFIISWKNPDESDRNLGIEDYRTLGVSSAIDAVSAIIPGRKIHAVGYCLGGTILAIAAATMARDGDDRLKTMTMFAAQTDFTEAGEIMVFIDDAQVRYLEDVMKVRGYLDTKEMVGAFQMLRSYDQFWSRVIHDYMMGERSPMFDLLVWNADATRMPAKMHSEYLTKLFLHNDLFEGRYRVGGRNIVLSDIHVPVFLVGTVKDHVAPWRSVYKFMLSSDAETVTFVLCSGGHNAGIVSEPGHPRRRYQIATRKEGEKYVDPDTWMKTTPVKEGSWWIPWQEWLAEHSTEKVAPPSMGAEDKGYPVICDAPGTYVHIS